MTDIERWLSEHLLSPVEVDCATTVMLKIIDGKCKMAQQEKVVMAALYDAVKSLNHSLLQPEVHTLIATARDSADEAVKLLVYEQRLLAETMISRPVMKRFKARIRQQGLLDDV
ncbi:hypothetical protein [Amphritea pacifica]|uniref:Uncharacterized protein n=1 Tax=Amphritea pacifica TaxID=2811233 RepID=A0ABS2W7P5_9GAMM|nr:hypothetical protein [Amphritea pacifica]MBN0987598.1 hypothetical protein [Amphritea pacifica]MBN1007443.1 hypothetical protein [Amphritea pacifica]